MKKLFSTISTMAVLAFAFQAHAFTQQDVAGKYSIMNEIAASAIVIDANQNATAKINAAGDSISCSGKADLNESTQTLTLTMVCTSPAAPNQTQTEVYSVNLQNVTAAQLAKGVKVPVHMEMGGQSLDLPSTLKKMK